MDHYNKCTLTHAAHVCSRVFEEWETYVAYFMYNYTNNTANNNKLRSEGG